MLSGLSRLPGFGQGAGQEKTDVFPLGIFRAGERLSVEIRRKSKVLPLKLGPLSGADFFRGSGRARRLPVYLETGRAELPRQKKTPILNHPQHDDLRPGRRVFIGVGQHRSFAPRFLELHPLKSEEDVAADFFSQPIPFFGEPLDGQLFFLSDDLLGEENEGQAGNKHGRQEEKNLFAMSQLNLVLLPPGRPHCRRNQSAACHENVMNIELENLIA